MENSSTPPTTETKCLYVDLDGSICVTDTLWESLIEIVRQRPFDLLSFPFWLAKGKASFKAEIANRVLPNVATLPLRPEVLSLLEKRRNAGQSLVLATAADYRIAHAFADRLKLFDGVLASTEKVNMSSGNKLLAVRHHSKGGPFDYLGDSSADLCLFESCEEGYVAGRQDSVWRAAELLRIGKRPLVRLLSSPQGIKPWIKALRPHQWAKNILVAVPLIVSHQVEQPIAVGLTILAFVSFCLIASAVYIINDLLDLSSDRVHPTKRKRPFACGNLSIPAGIVLGSGLLVIGVTVAYISINFSFFLLMLLYLATSTLYSTFLKRKLVLDVFILAALYTIRILAGSAAIGVRPSEWLLAFSLFIFTSLAMLKRYAELKVWSKLDDKWPPGRRYTISDMDLFRSIGPGAAYAAALVFALYISSPSVAVLYRRPYILWLVCPVILYWLTRLWFLTNRSRPIDDPVLFALTDKASLACGALVLALVFAAT